VVSFRPSKSDRHRPSPRLPPSPNSKHRNGAYEKEGALVTAIRGVVRRNARALNTALGRGVPSWRQPVLRSC
jgi:hypothetical protein